MVIKDKDQQAIQLNQSKQALTSFKEKTDNLKEEFTYKSQALESDLNDRNATIQEYRIEQKLAQTNLEKLEELSNERAQKV